MRFHPSFHALKRESLYHTHTQTNTHARTNTNTQIYCIFYVHVWCSSKKRKWRFPTISVCPLVDYGLLRGCNWKYIIYISIMTVKMCILVEYAWMWHKTWHHILIGNLPTRQTVIRLIHWQTVRSQCWMLRFFHMYVAGFIICFCYKNVYMLDYLILRVSM